jgi:hypothetical protein
MPLKSFDDPNSDEARQALLDRRCERNHPKRHRTLKRAKALSAIKRQKIKAKIIMQAKLRREYLAASRAYWAGEGAGHP